MAPAESMQLADMAVVVVAYNSVNEIADLVTRSRQLPRCASVVVVDNGQDGAASIAAEAGAKVLRRPDNPGFGSSQNAGVRMTSEPAVLLLNPDASPDPSGVEQGLRYLDRHASVGAVQGIVINRSTGHPERSMGSDLRWIHLVGRALGLRRLLGSSLGRRMARMVGVGDHVDRVPETASTVETLAAAALLVRREAFDSVGGFDESFFLYGEDLDLCRRLRLKGWKLVGMPTSWAIHDSGGSASSRRSRELTWWRGTMGYAARWWPSAEWAAALASAAIELVKMVSARPSEVRAPWEALIAGPCSDRRNLRRRSAAEQSDGV